MYHQRKRNFKNSIGGRMAAVSLSVFFLLVAVGQAQAAPSTVPSGVTVTQVSGVEVDTDLPAIVQVVAQATPPIATNTTGSVSTSSIVAPPTVVVPPTLPTSPSGTTAGTPETVSIQPVTSVVTAKLTQTLTLGTVSSEVKLLQQLLNANGFAVAASGPGSSGQETTKFGSLTRTAVEKFQCAKKIACTGQGGYGTVGPATRKALNTLTTAGVGVPSSASADSGTASVTGAPSTTTSGSTALLRMGVVDPAVKELQVYLNAHGYPIAKSGAGSPGQETTKFGSLTKAALQKFQCDKKIACSGTESTTGWGMVGPKTRAALGW